jgi:hypothetical protein
MLRQSAAGAVLLLSGCAAGIPNISNDYALPVSEILTNTTCELRRAFEDIHQNHPKFDAGGWLIGISLSPKMENEWTANVGLTGKTKAAPATRFNSWSLGPGLQADIKGHRDGGVSYDIKSADLLDEAKFPFSCDLTSAHYNALAQHLGIRDWLAELISAQEPAGKLVALDKPAYNTEVVIVWNGNGSFTYNFPLGTDVAGITGKYTKDETLSIALTKITTTGPIVVQTLPTGGVFGTPAKAVISTTSTIETAKQRLDQMQLEQVLKNALPGN